MTPVGPTFRGVEAVGEEAFGHVRRPFLAYADEHAASIAEGLSVQGFETELDGLPGRYAPASGWPTVAR